MAANKQGDTNELKKRFDTFYREARFQEKPLRMFGRPQISNKQVSVLIAYPTFENPADKEAFSVQVGEQLKAFGLEAAELVRQKSAVRVLARLRAAEAKESKSDE